MSEFVLGRKEKNFINRKVHLKESNLRLCGALGVDLIVNELLSTVLSRNVDMCMCKCATLCKCVNVPQ